MKTGANMEYRFQPRWYIPTGIGWWDVSRTQLNTIIDEFNNWQIHDASDESKTKILLATIEMGKQTIGSQDGGSGYWETLDEMEKFVIYHERISK